MNVLMVYPEYPPTYWSFKYVLKYIGKKATHPPLGLLTIAPLLPKEWNKRLIDMNAHKLHDSDLAWADMVMISAMLVQRSSVEQVIARAKAMGKTIVAGGPMFATMDKEFPGVDHVFVGEAEETLPQFVADWSAGCPQKSYKAAERPILTLAPVPDWSLIRLKDYATMPVQYSRGCPYDCEFCDIITIFGRIPRVKDDEQVIKELESLFDYGWRGSVFFVDDNFIGNKLHVKQLLRRLKLWQVEHNHPFQFITEASVNLAQDEGLMTLMQQANFYKVFVGIESPNPESLQECQKAQNVKIDLGWAVRTIHEHGMEVMGGFIVGFDHDDEGIFDRQIKWIQEHGVVQAMVGLLTALPGTQLWRRLNTAGRLLGESSGTNTGAQALNFRPTMNPDVLRDGLRRIQRYIYEPSYYYQRIRTFLKHYRPKVRSKTSPRDILALIKSLIKIGVLSRSRWQYWRLLISTFFTKINKFPAAVTLAIFGEHFRKHAEET